MSGFWAKCTEKVSWFFVWAIDNHPGKLIGTSLGFILGLLILILGIWRTLVLVLFVVVGFMLGKRQDENQSITTWLERNFKRN